MFTLNFEERFADEDVETLKERMASETRFWIERNYGDVMVNTAGPHRMVHLKQRMANDGHMAELARKAPRRNGRAEQGVDDRIVHVGAGYLDSPRMQGGEHEDSTHCLYRDYDRSHLARIERVRRLRQGRP